MKNAINYYYNILVEELHHHDKKYFFRFNNYWYLLFPYDGNIKILEDMYQYFQYNHLYCHEILYNNHNEILTNINSIPYILLKEYYPNRKIVLKDIVNMTIPINISKKINWKKLWCEKLDYYEYQMNQYEKKFPILSESFIYYDGLTELAISLLNIIEREKIDQYISHFRITKNTTTRDLYNPLTFIIDSRVRDSTEYFKDLFFQDKNPIDDVKDYIHTNYLSGSEIVLFISRLLYPSYYFDIYDQIIKGEIAEEEVKKIINKTDDYENFLRDVYTELSLKYKLPELDWLKK